MSAAFRNHLIEAATNSLPKLRIAIAIATAGRREGLSETIQWLHGQTRPADGLYICPASNADLDKDCLKHFPGPTHVVHGERGLPAQRNAILRQLDGYDLVLFLDDDFLPEAHYLEELEALCLHNPDIAIATGHVVADGATNAGISYERAVQIIKRLPKHPRDTMRTVYNGYGCNMAVRVGLAHAAQIEFDEVLPLYAWWEDVDFSRRLAPYGRIVRCDRMRGVHQGSKKGRSPGKRLGYSQVANILYMVKKGSVSGRTAFIRISRNVLANLVRSAWPEPWVDRRGRFAGNVAAIRDAMAGKIDPQEILKF